MGSPAEGGDVGANMSKPRMKRTIGIRNAYENQRHIYFDATPDIAAEMKDYGKVMGWEGYWLLRVDSRYDFNDVLEYMRNYTPVEVPDALDFF